MLLEVNLIVYGQVYWESLITIAMAWLSTVMNTIDIQLRISPNKLLVQNFP